MQNERVFAMTGTKSLRLKKVESQQKQTPVQSDIQPMSVPQYMLGLQRQYGNHLVQQVMNLPHVRAAQDNIEAVTSNKQTGFLLTTGSQPLLKPTIYRLKEPLPPTVRMPRILSQSIPLESLSDEERKDEIGTITEVLTHHRHCLTDEEIHKLNSFLEELRKREVPPLTKEQRKVIENVTRDKILAAYASFISACKDVKMQRATLARARAEMVGVLAEITMGFLAPGLARGIAKLADGIPVDASNMSYRVAIAMLNQEQVKTSFTAATKFGHQKLKDNAKLLFGEGETDAFIRDLEVETQIAYIAVASTVYRMSDRELGVICALFDPEVANNRTYVESVNRMVNYFQVVVEPIRKGEGSLVAPSNRAYWVEGSSGKRLAILGRQWEPHAIFPQPSKDKFIFGRWVHPAFQTIVIKRMEITVGKIETVQEHQVSGIREGYD